MQVLKGLVRARTLLYLGLPFISQNSICRTAVRGLISEGQCFELRKVGYYTMTINRKDSPEKENQTKHFRSKRKNLACIIEYKLKLDFTDTRIKGRVVCRLHWCLSSMVLSIFLPGITWFGFAYVDCPFCLSSAIFLHSSSVTRFP